MCLDLLEPGDLYLEEHFAVRQERHEVSEGIRPLLEPIATLRTCEAEGDFSRRLALLEELKSMPFSAVWDQFCLQAGVPVGAAWIDPVKAYERTVQSRR